MKISVIIPAYNATETLADAVQSAIAQVISVYDERFPRGGAWPDGPSMLERLCRAQGHTGESLLLGPYLDPAVNPLEIVVVNDGSKDDTLAYARSLAAQSPQGVEISVVDQPNGGPASARNHGIRVAKGELIALLDADDLWLPRKLSRQLQSLASNPKTAMCYSDTLYFRHTGIYNPPGLQVRARRGGDIFDSLMTVGNFIPNLTVLMRRDVLDEITASRGGSGPYDDDREVISSEDYELWLQISARARVAYVRESLAWYRVHAGGINWRHISRSHNAARAVVDRMARHPRAIHIDRDVLDQRLAKSWYEQGYEHAEAGQLRQALQCHLRSFMMHPTGHATRGMLRSAIQSLPGLRPEPRTVADRGTDAVSFVS